MQNLDEQGRDLNAWPWNAWQIPMGGVSRDQLLTQTTEAAAELLGLAAVLATTDKVVKQGGTAAVLVPRRRNGHGVFYHQHQYGAWCDDSQYDFTTNPHFRLVAALLAAGYVVAGENMSTTQQWGDVTQGEAVDTAWAFAKKFVPGKWVHVGTSKGAVSALLTCSPGGPAGHDHFGEGVYIVDGVTNLDAVYIRNNAFAPASEVNTAYNIPGGGTYAALTAGRDPNLLAGNPWSGKRLRAVYSTGDTIIQASTNWLTLLANKTGGTLEASSLVVSGEHAAASHFVGEDVVSFVGRCVNVIV